MAKKTKSETPAAPTPNNTTWTEADRPVIDIEGIGPDYAQKLERVSVTTVQQLHAADPAKVADMVGVPETTVRAWQAMAELIDVGGVGPQVAELLVKSGVTSIAQLAQADATELLNQVEAANAERKVAIQGGPAGEKSVKNWIAAAQNHPLVNQTNTPVVKAVTKKASKTETKTEETPVTADVPREVSHITEADLKTTVKGIKDPKGPMKADPHEWVKEVGLKNTGDVEVPRRLIDQVLGQEVAVAVARKAAEQRRHLLLIGDPGTGKSMLAKAMAEVLPKERQKDILIYHNDKNANNPKLAQFEGGQGREVVQKYEKKARKAYILWRIFEYTISFALMGFGFYMWFFESESILVFLFCVLIALIFLYAAAQKRPKSEFMVPKLLIEHSKESEPAPYVDGTGAHAGALLGDVRHDPFQSGGLETPAHQRVEVGAIHRANRGVLFIDEINVLRLPSQQALLTALQEGKYSIVGQSQSSAGAMVKTDPVPCDFILVAAGNLDAVAPAVPGSDGGMHPALRSRIRGYGYEVYVNSTMDDTHINRAKLCQFVAQEVARDGRIPHFDAPATAEVIREAQRRAGQTGKLTLRLRELGGLVRTAGDYAMSDGAEIVTLKHVRMAKSASRSLEQQITETEIKRRLSHIVMDVEGSVVGTAHGSAVIGTGEVGEPAGLVVPVEAAVVPALSRTGGAIILGESLREIKGSGVENVGAVLKILKGSDIADHDLHIDARINHPDAFAQGIGIAAAVAAVSALESIPVRQDYIAVGTIAVTGELRHVEASLQRIETAAALGYKYVIVPEGIRDSLLLDDYIREKIQVIFSRSLVEVLDHMLDAPTAVKKKVLGALEANASQKGRHASGSARATATATVRRAAARKGGK